MPEVNLGKVVGPRGPQGPAGPEGPQGVQGVPGPKGDPGSGTNPNLLCNWYFADPVNQRGVSGDISADGYFIDRWKTNAVAFNGKLTVSDGGITLDNTQAHPLSSTISQFFEWSPDLNANYTLSVLDSEDILHIFTGKFLKGSSVKLADNNGVGAQFNWTGGQSILFYPHTRKTFVAAKLELGDRQTLARQESGKWVLNEVPDPALELARCQRYYVRFAGEGMGLFSGTGSGKQVRQFKIPLPVSMRAAPTVKISGDFSWGLGTDASMTYSGRGDLTPNGVIVGTVSCGSTLTPDGYQTVSMMEGAEIVLDAEL